MTEKVSGKQACCLSSNLVKNAHCHVIIRKRGINTADAVHQAKAIKAAPPWPRLPLVNILLYLLLSEYGCFIVAEEIFFFYFYFMLKLWW